jgi:glycosyltransferase involved in cell wall biosynthesis
MELSVVIPCLNEADTLAVCIEKITRAFEQGSISGEIIVADNGSTDASRQIATSLGARLVDVKERGYGNALQGGIEAARGKFIIMADGDDSYDFGEIPKFVAKLREGFDIVQGCRLPAGGGTVMPRAMPRLHRWLGNPGFSLMAQWWFRAPIHDVYCGMRGFTRELYQQLDLRCPGMEFATEMIIKASRSSARLVEVPITLHPDGRKSHPPHLKTFRDGWRTLRFFLILSPKWLFLEPGKLLILLGCLGYILAMPGLRIGGVEFGLNTLVFASLALLCGQQAILLAIGAKSAGVHSGLNEPDERVERFFKIVTLERSLIAAVVACFLGISLLVTAVLQWRAAGFGHLNYDHSLRVVIPGATLVAAGLQNILASFFLAILDNPRR